MTQTLACKVKRIIADELAVDSDDLHHTLAFADEIWAPVPGYDGSYEVSTLGRVRSMARTITVLSKTRSGVARHIQRRLSERLIGENVSPLGYTRVRLGDELHFVHRLVLTTFVGPRPDGHICRHLDGDQSHNHLTNLAWGTTRENSADTDIRGTRPLGAARPNAKLSDRCIPAIRTACRTFPTAVVASAFGVCRSSILQIQRGITWAHVTEATDEDAEAVKRVGDLIALAERLAAGEREIAA